MTTTLESQTAPIPGTENANFPHETSLHRVTTYPVVKDTLDQAYSVVQSYDLTKAAYARIEQLSASVLAVLTPRLPLETVDGYANAGLDYLEKKVPSVKTETSASIVQKVRKPADDAVGIARSYSAGIQSRLSPVTNPLAARLAQGQETLGKLQARLSEAVGALPRDKASAQDAMNSIFREVEAISTYVTSNAKELPDHAKAAVKPVIDNLGEALTHIREELSRKETPLATKATNILSYSQSQVGPLLNSLKEVVVKKKEEIEANGATHSDSD